MHILLCMWHVWDSLNKQIIKLLAPKTEITFRVCSICFNVNSWSQKFTPPWFLILCCYLNDPQLCVCSVIVVHESLVCPEQLNCLLFFRKILQLTQIIWFSIILVYLNPFQHWLYGFEINLFTPRTTEGLVHIYYRRFKHSLMLQKENHALRVGGG